MAQLEGVSSWVAHVAGGELSKLEDIVAVAEGAESVKNVAILVSGAQNVKGEELKKVEEMMKSKATTFEYTLVVVPEWNDEPEANCAFGIVNVTDVVDDAPFGEDVGSFSREESLRIITEALAIDKAAVKCVVATAAPDAKSLETYLVQGMREIGFDRLQEVEHMVTRGVKVCILLMLRSCPKMILSLPTQMSNLFSLTLSFILKGYNEMLATEKEGVAWEKAPKPPTKKRHSKPHQRKKGWFS